MNIYLDTYTIQKWQNKTLPKLELDFLDDLFLDSKTPIVLSPNHLWEICSRDDLLKSIGIGDFLDKLPNKLYIKSSDDLFDLEIKQAYRAYCDKRKLAIPIFVDSLVHTFATNVDSFELRLSYGTFNLRRLIGVISDPKAAKTYQDRLKPKITSWAIFNHEYASRSGALKSEGLKIVFLSLSTKIEKLLKSSDIVLDAATLDDFISYLSENPEIIPGLSLSFWTQHVMHKNSAKFKTSDISDLSMLAFAPYVDFMVLDKKNYNMAIQTLGSALVSLNDTLGNKLNSLVKYVFYRTVTYIISNYFFSGVSFPRFIILSYIFFASSSHISIIIHI